MAFADQLESTNVPVPNTGETNGTVAAPNAGGPCGTAPAPAGAADSPLPPEAFPFLAPYGDLRQFFPLFHELTKSGEEDFVLRLALIQEMVARPRESWSYDDLDREFSWIPGPKRNYLLRSLRDSGWLAQDPYDGYQLTEVAQVVCSFVAFLRGLDATGDSLGLAVLGLEYHLKNGRDPLPLVAQIRLRLAQLVDRADAALSSRSRPVIMRTRDYLEESLAYSADMRRVLASTDYADSRALREARAAHRLLARLHEYRSELNRLVVEMGRSLLTLSGGVTEEQIAEHFLNMDVKELAALARRHFHSPLPAWAYILPDILVSTAEDFLSKDLVAGEQVEPWGPVTEVQAASATRPSSKELEAFVAELTRYAEDFGKQKAEQEQRQGQNEEQGPERPQTRAPASVPLTAFVPRGNRGTSYLRLHLLSLLQPLGKPVARRETAVGRLVRLPLKVETGPGEIPVREGGLVAMSPGTLGPAPEPALAPAPTPTPAPVLTPAPSSTPEPSPARTKEDPAAC